VREGRDETKMENEKRDEGKRTKGRMARANERARKSERERERERERRQKPVERL